MVSLLIILFHSVLTISLAKNPEHHGRMKHLDLRYYWLRDEVAKGTISVHYVSTRDMPADALTKALNRDTLSHLLPLFGLTS